MCGIAGTIIFQNNQTKMIEKSTIKTMKKLMVNRGPDHQEHFFFKKKNFNLNFFVSRLSILDLDRRSNQPFTFDNLILIYNGEIFNFLEIRKELESYNYKFNTQSDTEVLIKSYHHWGEKCVNKFDGMWSFAIFDKNKNKIFVSRDPFGEKPFYFYFDNSKFIFGSEIKYIQTLENNQKTKIINNEKLFEYLGCGYKSLYKNEKTFYKNIFELKGGHNLFLELNDKKIYKKKYFRNLYKKNISSDINENIYIIKNLLINSVKVRLRSDVPIAFCLSGGIDSGSIASIAYKEFNIKPNCYSIIDNDKRYNELKNINEFKSNIDCNLNLIHTQKVKFNDFYENLSSQISYSRIPVSTISYYNHNFLVNKIKDDKIKVVLSGTGADEIFTGYYDHHLMFLSEIYKSQSYKRELSYWNKYIKKNIRNKNLRNKDLFIKNSSFREHIYYEKEMIKKYVNFKIPDFIESNYHISLLKNRLSNELKHESVPVILNSDDLNSMKSSVENRSPFLSLELVKYALSIKNCHYIKNGYTKHILREAVKNILPEKIRVDRKKIGFNSNLQSVTKLNNKELYEFFSESDYLKNIINLEEIKKINLNKPLTNSQSKMIFSMINTKIFLDQNKL